ncbi:unnamed protein product [Colias eurytheme]|nr:unnamed protein product [Colias eurytheme]
MYNNADKTEPEVNIPEDSSKDLEESGTTSHVYPLMIADMDYPLAEKSRSFENKRDDLVNYTHSGEVAETFSVIRRNFAILWDDDDEISNIIAKDSTKPDEVIEDENKT